MSRVSRSVNQSNQRAREVIWQDTIHEDGHDLGMRSAFDRAPSQSGNNVPVLLHSAQEDEARSGGKGCLWSILEGGALLQGRLKVGNFQLFQNVWGTLWDFCGASGVALGSEMIANQRPAASPRASC